MHRRSQPILFGYALYLLLCGLVGYALAGIDTQVHLHGVRLALAVGVCAVIAGRVNRTRALAVFAIDFSALLILAAGLNYVRLGFKWYGIQGGDWYTPYLASAMALGSFVTLPLLVMSRPKPNRFAAEWWRPSPLISIPILVLIRFPRCRHGLGVVRRGGLTLGALMLIIGFLLTNGDRLPRRSVAVMLQTARLAQEHHEFLRDILEDPQELKQILTDPEQLEELLDDPRAQDLIEDLTAEGGLLEGKDIRAMAERIADGDLGALDELLDDEGLSAAKEALLADINREDGALSELLDKDELAAARTLLSRTDLDQDNSDKTLDDETISAAKILLVSAADSDSTKRQNVASVLQEVAGASTADFSGSFADLKDIDINDPKVQQVLRELDIDPKEAARLASDAAKAPGLKEKLIRRQLTAAMIASHFNATAQSRLNSKLPSQRTATDRLAPQRQSSRLATQGGGTTGSRNNPRLGVHSIQIKPAPQPEPAEPLDVLTLVDPQPGFVQQRLGEHFASETSPIEPALDQPNAEQPLTSEAVATAPITALHPSLVENVPPQVDEQRKDEQSLTSEAVAAAPITARRSPPVEDTPPQLDDQTTRVAAQISPPAPTEVDRNDDPIQPTASALTHLGTRLPPMAGTLCILAGFLTIGLSLSRR